MFVQMPPVSMPSSRRIYQSLTRAFKGECKIHFSDVTATEKSKAAEKQKEKRCRREAGAGAGRGKGGEGTRRKQLVALFRGRA